MAKYLDENGLLYFWQKIKTKFVAAESGKGLSTNDYTTDEKNKLANIEAQANKYSLPTASADVKGGIKVGAGLTMTGDVLSANTQEGTKDYTQLNNKPTINSVELTGNKTLTDLGIASSNDIPTNNNQLTNGAGYITNSALNGYATESFVTGKGYITSSALSGYATEQYVNDKAEGKKATYVYQDKSALDTALADATFSAKLQSGDVFLLIAVNEPDYWWTGTGLAELQSRTFDLAAISNTEIDTILAS